ncbi:MAG: metallophosphoesterase [Bacilli bacterium]|nr:metallophosphoesterase [Bacilli bacterium]
MRNFIISDLHGNGYIYDSVLNYLQNELEYGNDDITLYINGDLIDRGLDSGSMLVDLYERVTNNIGIKICLLGGNHEHLMYHAYLKSRDKNLFDVNNSSMSNDWINYNAGFTTSRYLLKYLSIDDIDKLMDYISNLDVYHIFDEKINDKNILLTHACFVMDMLKRKPIKINEDLPRIVVALYTRKEGFNTRTKLGNDNFFTIVGHTPIYDECGYSYDRDDNILNIDGASALFGFYNTNYLYKRKYTDEDIINVNIPFSEYDEDVLKDLNDSSHSPLVEILDNKLRILTFNYKNEIIQGNYFEDGISIPIDNNELNSYRKYLNESKNTKKRVRLYDKVI